MLLWVGDPDYEKWKYKRRNTVLGLWHQIKKSMWQEHLYYCEMIVLAKEEAVHEEEMEQRLPGEQEELDHIELAYVEASKSPDLADIPF